MNVNSPVPFAAPALQSMPSSGNGLLRVTLALIVVLAAVFLAAWLSRRMRGLAAGRSASLQLLAQLPLGPRERAVLIRLGERQLLLGVANGSVRTLHVLEPTPAVQGAEADAARGVGAQVDGPPRPSFKALLMKSLGK